MATPTSGKFTTLASRTGDDVKAIMTAKESLATRRMLTRGCN